MNDMLNFCNKDISSNSQAILIHYYPYDYQSQVTDHPIYEPLQTIREGRVYFYWSKNAKEIHKLGMLRVTEQCHITSYLPECNYLCKECHFFESWCIFQGLIYLISQYLRWALFQGGSYSSGSLFETLEYTLGAIKMYATQVIDIFEPLPPFYTLTSLIWDPLISCHNQKRDKLLAKNE